jgi:hypothetical protein
VSTVIESKTASLFPPGALSAEPGELPRLYTYADIAAMMRVGVQTVFEWVKRGKVPSPNYIGHTARFTAEHVTQIVNGVQPAGTFTAKRSPRAEIGKLGVVAKKKKKKKPGTPKGKPGRPPKLVADTPAAKKIAAKKRTKSKPAALKAKVLK